MKNSLVDRVVKIMAYLYKYDGEVIHDVANEKCILFFQGTKQLTLNFEELDCLAYNEIVEIDSGNDEPGQETRVYKLTGEARVKIKIILDDMTKLKLKLLKN